MNFTCPQSFSELTQWQREEICYLLLDNSANFEQNYLQMIAILFLREPTKTCRKNVIHLFREVPIRELLPYGKFLLERTDLYEFPQISDKLHTPMARLSDCTIKQFSVSDAIFYKYSQEKKEVYAQQLVASLYHYKGEKFDSLKLPEVAVFTDTISPKRRAQIIFVYRCVREYIIERYPAVFPKGKKEEDKPVFKQKNAYIPFSKVIAAMAMDTTQPLGNWHECSTTRLYDFFDILNEAILRNNT